MKYILFSAEKAFRVAMANNERIYSEEIKGLMRKAIDLGKGSVVVHISLCHFPTPLLQELEDGGYSVEVAGGATIISWSK